jgi:RecA/RadA recombinase
MALTLEERERALKAATEQIEKKPGKGAIMRLGDRLAAVEPASFRLEALRLISHLAWEGYPEAG